MKTTIDHAGRVVIPKALRIQYHLTGGTELEIVADGDALRLRQPQAASRFTEKDGVLVQTGEPQLGIDAAAFINQQRDARALGTAAFGKSS
ncbi:MAG: AbrB/MazE/SpoVT family DNA-binding domain-containing protein [Puniceicoccaceae bacterium]|nr:MAG: AbrB/MazE/SpoVT family DNA-binding domain-containing protein [Puniceicoccaceae bacterium]